MTIDKTVDVRPDMVMLALYFGSVMVKNHLFSGLLFGVSFLVLPKILFSLPALLYARTLLASSQRGSLKQWAVVSRTRRIGFLRIPPTKRPHADIHHERHPR